MVSSFDGMERSPLGTKFQVTEVPESTTVGNCRWMPGRRSEGTCLAPSEATGGLDGQVCALQELRHTMRRRVEGRPEMAGNIIMATPAWFAPRSQHLDRRLRVLDRAR